MSRLLRKLLFSLVLLAAGGWLCISGYTAYRLRSRDLDFILNSPLASLSAKTWLYRGNYKSLIDHNPAAAAEYYRKAMSMEPSFIDTWIGLARAELAQGREDETRRVLKIISPAIAEVSTWKVMELQFAFELRDENAFDACLNYILIYLPNHVQEASRLASEFWGGWETTVTHVSDQGRKVFLDELMRLKEPDAALLLWEKMRQEGPAPEENLQLRICQFLLDCGRVQNAKMLWCEWKGNGCLGVYDGGFEHEPLNSAFGWRLATNPDFLIERTSEGQYKGNWCLHLRFSGKKNLNLNQSLQVVPVEPGRPYRLRFARKAGNLTTQSGVFMEVIGYGCEGLHVQSEPVTGTTGWIEEQLDLPIPRKCEAITLLIRRNESLKFDCNISGDYWLDAVEMETLGGERGTVY